MPLTGDSDAQRKHECPGFHFQIGGGEVYAVLNVLAVPMDERIEVPGEGRELRGGVRLGE